MSMNIRGIEFDWFCADRNGRLALVATNGAGPVPDDVFALAEDHSALADSIDVIGWGTREVWQSYAIAGLYVYDWDLVKNSYVQVSVPTDPVLPDLAEAIRGLRGVPKLDVDFSQDKVIQVM